MFKSLISKFRIDKLNLIKLIGTNRWKVSINLFNIKSLEDKIISP